MCNISKISCSCSITVVHQPNSPWILQDILDVFYIYIISCPIIFGAINRDNTFLLDIDEKWISSTIRFHSRKRDKVPQISHPISSHHIALPLIYISWKFVMSPGPAYFILSLKILPPVIVNHQLAYKNEQLCRISVRSAFTVVVYQCRKYQVFFFFFPMTNQRPPLFHNNQSLITIVHNGQIFALGV